MSEIILPRRRLLAGLAAAFAAPAIVRASSLMPVKVAKPALTSAEITWTNGVSWGPWRHCVIYNDSGEWEYFTGRYGSEGVLITRVDFAGEFQATLRDEDKVIIDSRELVLS